MSTSKVTVESIVTGLPEGGSIQSRFQQTNSSGVRVTYDSTFSTGASAALSIVSPPSAKFMAVVMPSTNTYGVRVASSTAEVGLPLSSRGASIFCIPESTVGSTFYFWTTGAANVSGARVIFS